ncbi:MAG: ion transporter [Bacteroidales bacterium]|nr:ion transporter [Bacteroidales bacterium]
MKKNRINQIRSKLYEIIFEADTPAGKAFDVVLLIFITLSVAAVMLESVQGFNQKYHDELIAAEWAFTIIFSVEYVLRVFSAKNARRYIFSFYGIIDLLAILPSYLRLFLAGSQYLLIIRILRLLRIFRVLKLGRYIRASGILAYALKESRHKIIVFLEVVLALVVIMGSMMYIIEGPDNGFSSIPRSIYWAIVTLTTVGYGDIAPQTVIGQTLASVVMIIGYAIIAVPTGIISVEIAKAENSGGIKCKRCHKTNHDNDAVFCKYCGSKLEKETV